MGKNKKKNNFVIDDDDNVNNMNVKDDENEWREIKKPMNTFACLIDDDNKDEMVSETVNESKQNKLDKKQLFKQALEQDDLGNVDSAIELYSKADEAGSKNAAANLAILLHEQKKYDQAEKYYLKAIKTGNIGSLYDYTELLLDKLEGNLDDGNIDKIKLNIDKYFSLYLQLKNANHDEIEMWKKICKI